MNKDCPRVLDLLVDYLEGELSEEQCAELETHIGHCPSCDTFVENYRNTGKVCKSALLQSMPAPLENALLDYLKSKLQAD